MASITWEVYKKRIEEAFTYEGKGYTLVGLVGEFVGAKSRVLYACPRHGNKEMTINHLSKGKRCAECAGCAAVAWPRRKEMVESWLINHGGRYSIDPNYDGSNYKNASSEIPLLCKDHGPFTLKSGHIKRGQGCYQCGYIVSGDKRRSVAEDVISRIKGLDTRYTFAGFIGGVYVNSRTKVIRVCREHGEFHTSVSKILHKVQGCPSCANYGYDDSKPGHLYGLLSACGKYLKIGITNKLEQRLRQLKSATPFEFHVLNVYKDVNGTRCRMLEGYFHKTHESAGLSGFDGATEWMAADTAIIAEFTRLCNEGRRPRGWRK